MKKITMLIIAAFIVITSANAQTADKIIKAIVWVKDKGEWVVNKRTYPETMYVVMVENDIRISNASDSRYITYGNPRKENTEDYDSRTWDAYDEESKKCTFTITIYHKVSGYSIFAIYENDIAIQYVVAEK